MPLRRRQRSLAFPAGVLTLVLAALLLAGAVPAAAVQITATGAAGFPNERTLDDPPSKAIDGSTGTLTWTTAALNTEAPSFLAIGFASSQVNRLRIFKTNETGTVPATAPKNLVVQYTTGSGPLPSRGWANVPNLRNGFNGIEPLTASAVNSDGTVSGDNHANSFASLTFETVQATGLRIGFSPVSSGSCSSNPNGLCNHYRVAEFQAPSRVSLRSLKTSKCVRVSVASTRAARVLVTIFSGRRSVRLFGQRLVVFTVPGRRIACIQVPRRAKTFNVRMPLSFAVGYALGARSRPGQRSPAPVIRPIRLTP